MKKAIQKAQEIREDWRADEQVLEEKINNELKPEINNILHVYLPETTTLKETEVLAYLIYDIITEPDKYLKP